MTKSTTRKAFIRNLIGGMLAAAIPRIQDIAPHAKGYVLNRFHIAGFQYYGGPRMLKSRRLKRGCKVVLVPEPTNAHDNYAVLIMFRHVKLGYVPRTDNKHLHRLLRQGATLEGRIVNADREAAPWRAVKLEVALL